MMGMTPPDQAVFFATRTWIQVTYLFLHIALLPALVHQEMSDPVQDLSGQVDFQPVSNVLCLLKRLILTGMTGHSMIARKSHAQVVYQTSKTTIDAGAVCVIPE